MADIRQTKVGSTTYDVEPQSTKNLNTNNVVKLNSSKKFANSNITDDGTTITLNSKVTLVGTGGSYNEGLRILPASNGWSNIFLSGDSTLDGTHDGGWLIGRRGAASGIGAVGDFTIENNASESKGLTLHKNGDATIYGKQFRLADAKVALQYDTTNECLNFVFA